MQEEYQQQNDCKKGKEIEHRQLYDTFDGCNSTNANHGVERIQESET